MVLGFPCRSGITVLAYLDDWLVLRSVEADALANTTRVLNALHGFRLDHKQGQVVPHAVSSYSLPRRLARLLVAGANQVLAALQSPTLL